jgi:hypothetical protein
VAKLDKTIPGLLRLCDTSWGVRLSSRPDAAQEALKRESQSVNAQQNRRRIAAQEAAAKLADIAA